MICENITIGANGHLHFAGQDTVALAKQYGTPLYLLDEDYIRHQCRVYQNAFKKHFGPSSRPLYASKANAFKRIYEIMKEEGMGIDVVSSGGSTPPCRRATTCPTPTSTATIRPMGISCTVWITILATL